MEFTSLRKVLFSLYYPLNRVVLNLNLWFRVFLRVFTGGRGCGRAYWEEDSAPVFTVEQGQLRQEPSRRHSQDTPQTEPKKSLEILPDWIELDEAQKEAPQRLRRAKWVTGSSPVTI